MSRNYPKMVGAITVIQPWAYVILHKGKNVENRPTSSHYRGTIAIHASATNSKSWFDDCPFRIDRKSVPYGAIVGFAELADVITKRQVTSKTRKWFGGKYGYVLSNVIILKVPIPAKGERRLWKLKGKVLKKALDQLSASQLKRLRPFEKVKPVGRPANK